MQFPLRVFGLATIIVVGVGKLCSQYVMFERVYSMYPMLGADSRFWLANYR